MSHEANEHAAGKPAETQDAAVRGIPAGTVILTLDGALPVDFLSPGDRIITREGMQVLRAVDIHRYSGPAIRVAAGALGNRQPEQDLDLPDTTTILLRDQRAEALCGTPQALVPIARIADGTSIVPIHALSMRLYELRFDTPQVVYAEGLELACEAVAADVKMAAE